MRESGAISCLFPIEDGTLDPANHFNLVVQFKGNVVEVFKDLSMDEIKANHVELAINERSDFITSRIWLPSWAWPRTVPPWMPISSGHVIYIFWSFLRG